MLSRWLNCGRTSREEGDYRELSLVLRLPIIVRFFRFVSIALNNLGVGIELKTPCAYLENITKGLFFSVLSPENPSVTQFFEAHLNPLKGVATD